MTDSLFDDTGQPSPELVQAATDAVVSDPTVGAASHLARRTDPPTSHAAAADIDAREGTGPKLRPGTHKALMLRAYGAGEPLADHEAAARCGLYRAHVCYWHRAGDLLAEGLLDDTGETRVNPDTGKARRVCRINDAGRAELARLDRLKSADTAAALTGYRPRSDRAAPTPTDSGGWIMSMADVPVDLECDGDGTYWVRVKGNRLFGADPKVSPLCSADCAHLGLIDWDSGQWWFENDDNERRTP